MKESLWGYIVIILGVTSIVFIYFFQTITNTDQQNYTLLRETTESAMYDSIDEAYYQKYGVIKINTEKFVENFTRRFAESVNDSKDYTLEFYEIYEYPPKATVIVKTKTKNYSVTTDSSVNFDIINALSGILETKY